MRRPVLTLHDVAAKVPWRARFRGVASAETLRVAFGLIGRRARSNFRAMADPDTNDYVRRLEAVDQACAALLADESPPVATLSAEIEQGIADFGPLSPSGKAGAEALLLVGRISDETAEVAELAQALREKARALVDRLAVRVDPRIDHEKRLFIWHAALMWETLTGKWPGSGRTGPFVEFCAFAWIECDMRDLGPDVEDALGLAIEKGLSKDAIAKLAGG